MHMYIITIITYILCILLHIEMIFFKAHANAHFQNNYIHVIFLHKKMNLKKHLHMHTFKIITYILCILLHN